ncbi:MAG: D-alanine--D-alanine ligase family protein [Erysipelotrichaceae bacterium]|nr:D-alanine--D-alanine ligase family protein [Erysipelotrichaceae bacterium]
MKLNIAVFFGGESCEHEISCITGNQALKAIDSDKYEITPIYVAKNSDLYTGEKLFELKNYYDLNTLCNSLDKICLYKDNNKTYFKPIKGMFAKAKQIDIAFLAMHGTNGEDGVLQGMLEMLDLPYTSSNVLGSALGQDKAVMKQVLACENIPMVPWFCVYSCDIEDKIKEYEKLADEIGYPLIVKPANLGSSIGIEVVHVQSELYAKLKEARNYDDKIVVEKMITKLKEVNISVMGRTDNIRLSAIEEVFKNDELLSFKDKYESNNGSKKCGGKLKAPSSGSKGMASTSRIVPARLKEDQENEIRDYASRSFKALSAKGVVRIDFMIDEETDKVYVNEINSIPGSLAFYLWKEVGVDFKEECNLLIENALTAYRNKKKKTRTFDTNILSNYKEN